MDLAKPETLVGKSILVGITYLDTSGNVERQVQHFGTVKLEHAPWSDTKGAPPMPRATIVVEREGKELVRFPYVEKALTVAKKGVYKLRSTGEEIADPDILSTWSVRARSQNATIQVATKTSPEGGAS